MRARLPLHDAFVERDGVRVHYEVYGNRGETILFLPPWPIVHSRVYKFQIPYFSNRYRCVAYDPRGNGRSDRPDDVAAYSLENNVHDALAVLDAVGAERAVLFGLSYGGLLACVIAAHWPARARAAILAATAATIGPAYPYASPDHFRAEPQRFEGWGKYNRAYWRSNYADFAEHFVCNIFPEPHSTKQIEDGLAWAAETSGAVLARTVEARAIAPAFDISAAMYRSITCPVLMISGDDDRIQPYARAQAVATATGAELVTIRGGGHNPLARFPALCNHTVAAFLNRVLATARPPAPARTSHRARRERRVLYLSSPIGLGHGRRDLAVVRELRHRVPAMRIDWLAQDPVTRLLDAARETIHPLSSQLVSESRHIELEAGDHELNVFQAIRRMDEVLLANFMVFQDAVETGHYDLVIADEAWDVDLYWHEHPALKRAALAWFTDFVGYVPMPEGARARHSSPPTTTPR